MLQQIVIAPGQIKIHDTDVPQCKENQVLVKMMRIGVCGSDIHVYHGKHPFVQYPLTQGHEVSGEIVQLGAKVSGLHTGQKVTIEPQVVCGECYPCRHGQYNLCETLKVMGFQTAGAAGEYFAVDASKITPLPDELTFDQGAMIEPVAVAVHAVKRLGELKQKKVVVLGAGPIGNLVMQVARSEGAAVMITDISQYRLALAGEVGADTVCNTASESLKAAIEQNFGKDKADVMIDCAGNNHTMQQAISLARKGSTILLIAVFDSLASVDLAVLNDHELDLMTSMMYRHEDYLDAIRLVQEGRVSLEPLMSKHFPFAAYDEAYRYIEQNREKTMKVLIDVHP